MNVFLTRGFRCVMSLLVLGFAVSLLMLAAVFPALSAKPLSGKPLAVTVNSAPPLSGKPLAVTPVDAVCADGRLTLQAVIGKAVEIEAAGAVGKMWNRLDRAPGGSAVLYVVFERMPAGAAFMFQDDCLVMFSESLPGDKLLEIGGKTNRVDAFGGKGI